MNSFKDSFLLKKVNILYVTRDATYNLQVKSLATYHGNQVPFHSQLTTFSFKKFHAVFVNNVLWPMLYIQ